MPPVPIAEHAPGYDWYTRRVGTTLEVGRPWKGVRGSSPGKKFQKLKPIASISGHLAEIGAISVYGNYNERLFDSAKNQEDATIGDKRYLPREKNSKIEANC